MAVLHHRAIAAVGVVCALLSFGSTASRAQTTTGSIAGVVRDGTGGVLPGVTVEAASPALIEKVRSAVTDGSGQYRIIDLRPGTYTVTFTLPGFGTVRREGLALTSGFTATVDGTLNVGAVEETVVVTGEAPVVDVQNVRILNLLSREELDTLPTAKTMQSLAALTLGASGVTQDVGGASGEGNNAAVIHGVAAANSHVYFDGFNWQNSSFEGGGVNKSTSINQWITQEVTIETSGQMAESAGAGMQVNYIPKDGGNSFSGTASGNYGDKNLQGINLDDALRARGVTTVVKIKKVFDVGGGFGGPIARDRAWFYIAQRFYEASQPVAGAYFNSTPHSVVYTPDTSRVAFIGEEGRDTSGRLTWQVTGKQRVGITELFAWRCNCPRNNPAGFLTSPEAMWGSNTTSSNTLGSWNYAVNNRLLFQGGFSLLYQPGKEEPLMGATRTDVPIWDLSRGIAYNAYFTSPTQMFIIDYGTLNLSQWNSRFSMSYTTGSHNFKVGTDTFYGWNDNTITENEVPGLGPVAYMLNLSRVPAIAGQLAFGVPLPAGVSPTALVSYNRLVHFASPWAAKQNGIRTGIYAQDQWTISRLTLNLGVRLDLNEQWTPAQSLPGGRFYPATSFAALDLVSWRDINPRAGAAYDLFGNGRTALKAFLGRYVVGDLLAIAEDANPAKAMVTATTRDWVDYNGDVFPQANELGRLADPSFGTVKSVKTYDPAILRGWQVRPYLWRTSASITHELRTGWGVDVAYNRTWFGNQRVTDNRLVTPNDYTSFCVTTPADSRLPDGGGKQICGLAALTPAAAARGGDYLVTSADTFGEVSETYDGLDFSTNVRFGKGGLLSGGIHFGKTEGKNCFVVDSPQQLYQCEQELPWKGQTQVKLAGSYPLPGGIALSAVFQMLPGNPINATWQIPAGVGGPAGSRIGALPRDEPGINNNPLGSQSIVAKNAYYEDRLTQLDLRLHYNWKAGRVRVQPQFDLYNILNANPILGQVTTFGGTFRRPTTVLLARLVKFGAQIDF